MMDWQQLFTSPWLWVGFWMLCIGFTGWLFLAAYRRRPVDDLSALIDATQPDGSHEDMGLDNEARALVIGYLNACWVHPTANYPERETYR